MDSTPSENLAQLLVTREGIVDLPVDVDSIARRFASVRELDIPFDFDGITVKGRNREPRIILNRNRTLSRRRFTLAHELGHILIPWHVGIIFDEDVQSIETAAAYEYHEMEAEANLFAAELLLPTAILSRRLETFLLLKAAPIDHFIRELASDAKASLLAAILRSFRLLPPGYVFVVVEDSGVVRYAGRSYATIPNAPEVGEVVRAESLYGGISRKSKIETDDLTFVFYEMRHDTSAAPSANTQWQPILTSMLEQHFSDDGERRKAYQRVNAILAAFYGTHLKGKESDYGKFYSALLQRIKGFPDLEWLCSHSDFSEFFSRKVSDLFSRQ